MSVLQDAVAEAVKDTPYVVAATKRGFDLRLDVVDARWWGMLHHTGLKSTFWWRVVEHPNHFTISDRETRVRWSAGVPRLAFNWEFKLGRIPAFTRQTIWALDGGGRIQPIVNYRFNSREGRDVIRAAAAHLGIKERLPRSLKVLVGLTALPLLLFGVVALVDSIFHVLP